MNVPETTIEELTQFYAAPRFRIKDIEGYSTQRSQRNGIRQGCPLSPYLFIIVMTTMMFDVHRECGEKRWSEASKELGDTELIYADDAVLISSTKKPLQTLLQTIEKHAIRYGLKLNRDKCEMITIKGVNTKIKFTDGSEVKHVSSATYLGANIDKKGYKTEVEARIQKAN